MTCEKHQPSLLLVVFFVLFGGVDGGGVGGILFDEIRTVVPLPSSCRDICKKFLAG